jgi:hypothetical protein
VIAGDRGSAQESKQVLMIEWYCVQASVMRTVSDFVLFTPPMTTLMFERDFDSTVRLAIMDALLAGRTPSPASVAQALHVNADDAAAAFDRLAVGRAIVLTPPTRDIRMAAPLAAVETDFRVHVGDRSVYANCIWDALGVPAMLAGAGRPATARIDTQCPDCADPLAMEVRDGRLTSDPSDAVVHFAVPAARWWADIVFT